MSRSGVVAPLAFACALAASSTSAQGLDPYLLPSPPAPPARPQWMIAAGAELSADTELYALLLAEVTYRFAGTPLALHAAVGGGRFGGAWMVSAAGRYGTLRLGVEGEWCNTGDQLCLVLGGDVGGEREQSDNSIAADYRALVAIGRGGVAFHRGPLRVRAIADVRAGRRSGGPSSESLSGGGATLTLGWAW